MKKYIYYYLLLFVSLLFAACEGKNVKDSNGRMRIINASYLSGGVNIDVDYKPVYATTTEYLNYSLFREYIAGNHKLFIRNGAGNIIIDTMFTMTENGSYTVVVYDSMNTIKHKFYQETFQTPIGSTSKLRFMHLSNDAPKIHLTKENDTSKIFDSYSNGMMSEYVTFISGQTYFNVLDANTSNTIYTQKPFNLEPGYFYTMYLKGNTSSIGTDSLGLFVISNNSDY